MPLIDNATPFPTAFYRKMGYLMADDQVLAMRGTLTLPEPGHPLRVDKVQRPMRWGDELSESNDNMLRACLLEDGDVSSAKRSTDIHISGTLWSPTDQASLGWTSAVQVGAMAAALQVHGPRRFVRERDRWRLTTPQPMERVKLDYRLSFGGLWLPDDGLADAQRTDYVSHDSNPAGRGWLPSAQDLQALTKPQGKVIAERIGALRELPAPQFEAPAQPVTHPQDRHMAQGFGPIARWWSPRRQRQGTFDDIWRELRAPEWPNDFDPAFFNSAHPNLTASGWLVGDEEIALLNCGALGERTKDGDRLWRTRMPGFAMYAIVQFASGRQAMTGFTLSTVHIDLDTNQVMLTWHACWPPEDEVEKVIIGGMSQAQWHASAVSRVRPYSSWNDQFGARLP